MRLSLSPSLLIKLAVAVAITNAARGSDGDPSAWSKAPVDAPYQTQSSHVPPGIKTPKSLPLQEPDGGRPVHDLNQFSGTFHPRPPSVNDGKGKIEPPAEEVASLLSDVLKYHLDGFDAVLLHKGSYFNQNVAERIQSMTVEPTLAWDLEVFFDTPPSAFPAFTRTQQKAVSIHCVAFVILADLEVVGKATLDIQRGSFFQGSEKRILAYTGSSLDLPEVVSHPTLGSGYHTVLVTVSNAAVSQKKVGGLGERAQRTYGLLRACPYCRDGHPEVSLADTWTPQQGFARHRDLFPDVFQNFNGHVFRIVTLEYAPFSCYEKTGGRDVRLKDCVDTRMMNAVAGTLNFTYKVREPADLQWGYKLDNGTYTGVIGAVQNYAADFSLNVAFTGDRERVIDYTVGYYNDPLTFCTTKPRPLNHALALLRPFEAKVWLGFALSLLVISVLYYVSCQILPDERQQRKNRTSHLEALPKEILNVFGTCISQGTEWNTTNGSRVLITAWVLFSLVTVACYVAMLIACYTLPTLSPTLNSLQDLVDSGFSWGIQDLGAADYQLFKTSQVPLYQRVFAGLDMCPDLNSCLARARDTRYAFITWRLYMEDRIAIKYTSSTGERQLHVATEDFFPSEIGWAMNPGCPFRQKFNKIIRRLLEAGLITKWLDQIINDPGRREAADVEALPRLEGPQPLGLEQLQGIFYVFVIGNAISVLGFVVECVIRSLSK
ncbi:glutamate receptor U1-like [Macrobrachium rosenbergii]|uniref:glutamate receptor U1-like n=1 Tax=Macrobrachium rosenbergii TaxID=79674 RepID=UPI0034D48ABA